MDEPDRFFLGNLGGETGDSNTSFRVNALGARGVVSFPATLATAGPAVFEGLPA